MLFIYKIKKKTMQTAVEKLRKYRDENYRSHDEIIELWTKILSKQWRPRVSFFGVTRARTKVHVLLLFVVFRVKSKLLIL